MDLLQHPWVLPWLAPTQQVWVVMEMGVGCHGACQQLNNNKIKDEPSLLLTDIHAHLHTQHIYVAFSSEITTLITTCNKNGPWSTVRKSETNMNCKSDAIWTYLSSFSPVYQLSVLRWHPCSSSPHITKTASFSRAWQLYIAASPKLTGVWHQQEWHHPCKISRRTCFTAVTFQTKTN